MKRTILALAAATLFLTATAQEKKQVKQPQPQKVENCDSLRTQIIKLQEDKMRLMIIVSEQQKQLDKSIETLKLGKEVMEKQRLLIDYYKSLSK